jgi:hypothetical protein
MIAGIARSRFPELLPQQEVVRARQVLVGLDSDAVGERGAAKILEAIPHATRFRPGDAMILVSTTAQSPTGQGRRRDSLN